MEVGIPLKKDDNLNPRICFSDNKEIKPLEWALLLTCYLETTEVK
jgi:hypothetical protein